MKLNLSNYNKKKLFIPLLLLAIFLCMCIFMYIINPVYAEMQEIYFYDLNGNRMTGSYIEGTKGEGAILVADKGQDMSYYLNMAQTLNKQGYSVMIYDLPGQGKSQGAYTTSFYEDNSAAMQVYSAMLAFSQLCSLPPANIHYIGHGFGARAILQACAVDYIKPVSITLINPEISFSSTIFDRLPILADDTTLSWIKDLENDISGIDVHIISTPAEKEIGQQLETLLNANNSTTLTNESFIIEPFAPLSSKVIDDTVSHLCQLNSWAYSANTSMNIVYNLILFLMLIVIFIFAIACKKALESYESNFDLYKTDLSMKFYLYKLLFWVPALAVGALGFAFAFLIPINYPVQSAMITFMFGAYGAVMIFVYVYSNFANDAGAGMFKDDERTNWISGVFIFIILFIMLKMFGHFGLYYMFPFAERWIWFILFSIINSLTFLVIDREFAVLYPNRMSKIKLISCIIAPFILLTLLLLLLGITAMAITLLVSAMGIVLVILFGRVLDELKIHIIIAAALQGILFTMLLLSSGIMIA